MLESPAVDEPRTDAVYRIVDEIAVDERVFEVPGPAMFEWYVENVGFDVNPFVDHSRIVELECMRSGLRRSSARGRGSGGRPPRMAA